MTNIFKNIQWPPQEDTARISAVLLGLSFAALFGGRALFGIFASLGVIGALYSGGISSSFRELFYKDRSPIMVMVFMVLAAWLPSVLVSILPGKSSVVLLRVVAILVVSVVVYLFMAKNKHVLTLCLKATMVGLCFSIVVAILGISYFPEIVKFLRGSEVTDINIARLKVRYFANFLALIAPFVFWAGFRLSGRWRFISALIISASIYVIYITNIRAGFAGLLAAGFVTFVSVVPGLWRKKTYASAIIILSSIFVGGVLFLISNMPPPPPIPVAFHDTLFMPPELIDPHRQIIWRFVMELAIERPWLGWGIHTINFAAPERAAEIYALYGLSPLPSHPHNWMLEVLSETGVVGFIPLLVTVMTLFWHSFRSYRQTGDIAYLALLATTASFWTSSFFNFSFWAAWWQISYLLLFAIMASSTRHVHIMDGIDQH